MQNIKDWEVWKLLLRKMSVKIGCQQYGPLRLEMMTESLDVDIDVNQFWLYFRNIQPKGETRIGNGEYWVRISSDYEFDQTLVFELSTYMIYHENQAYSVWNA